MSVSVRAHEKLRAWQEAFLLVRAIYSSTRKLPADEKFGLVAQMRRAAISIPSNIAEGAARGSNQEFLRFLLIARGSLAELETQIKLLADLGLDGDVSELLEQTETVWALLNGLIRLRKGKS